MLTVTNIERDLRQGETLSYESADHMLEVHFDDSNSWRGGFKIWFNGTYVHASKTFKPCERKLTDLVKKYRLERVRG